MPHTHDGEVLLGTSELTAKIRGSSFRLVDTVVHKAKPEVGDSLEHCCLVAELGRGASGQVFLAQQSSLSGRPLVLKVTSLSHDEHLNLARLQHTHIMPLYWTTIVQERACRVLAMPYLARATLSRLLRRLGNRPMSQRTGEQVFEVLQDDEVDMPVRLPVGEIPARALKRQSWIEFVIRVGAALAEALAFAHQRQMLHLDLKPSNILIAPDGTPILLDLDVARPPIPAGARTVSCLGGTQSYASPEQQAAMAALEKDELIPFAIDGRSDQYSLGVVLYECLGGTFAAECKPNPEALRGRLSHGLVDILARCLSESPADRYPDCQALAEDLEREVNHRPLRGVRNRIGERCRKWHRRHPYAIAILLLVAGFALAAGIAGFFHNQSVEDRRRQAEAALLEGQEWQRKGEHDAAIRRFHDGLDISDSIRGSDTIRTHLTQRLNTSQRLQKVAALRQAVHLFRFHALQDETPKRMKYVLEASGRKLWVDRHILLDSSAPLEKAVERSIRDQFLEMVLLWTELQVKLAPASHKKPVQEEVRAVLRETEALFGPSFALALAQQQQGMKSTVDGEPKTAWEHCVLGRFALAEGRLDEMDRHWQRALELEPTGFAANFYHGVGAMHQKRFDDAARAFAFCLGMDACAECFQYRGQALAALGEHVPALRDFDMAIKANPELGSAYALRGSLYRKLGRADEAKQDFERARELRE